MLLRQNKFYFLLFYIKITRYDIINKSRITGKALNL
nr:MAG TPA: hypothetical protein [Caudoviricetes sp.]